MPKGHRGKPPATCHPDRPHYIRGLCQSCYGKQYRLTLPKPSPEVNKKRNATPAAKNRKDRWLAKQPLTYSQASHLKHRYGVTLTEVKQLLLRQRNKCALCEVAFEKYVVDHDHLTGRVRGLLCTPCNLALGSYEKLHMNHRLGRYLGYNETHPRICSME